MIPLIVYYLLREIECYSIDVVDLGLNRFNLDGIGKISLSFTILNSFSSLELFQNNCKNFYPKTCPIVLEAMQSNS